MNIRQIVSKALIFAAVLALGACSRTNSDLTAQDSFWTGWETFDKTTTFFEALTPKDVTVNPQGMLAIEGGSFTIGPNDEFITSPRNMGERTVSVSSFYMDKYEVPNIAWREFVRWNELVFGSRMIKGSSAYDAIKDMLQEVLPDTTVWRHNLGYNDPYEEHYFRHPSYSFYPVVGVTWKQAMHYCQWRTDRVNEHILIQNKFIEKMNYSEWLAPMDPAVLLAKYQAYDDDPNAANKQLVPDYLPDNSYLTNVPLPDGSQGVQLSLKWIREHFVFSTEKYLKSNHYNPIKGVKAKQNIDESRRKVNHADGVLLVGYRLPTEAEWEYAAYAPIAKDVEEGYVDESKIYPWSGYHPRDLSSKQKGKMMANFVRGKGDYAGVAGTPNDGYIYTAPVDAFEPNDFGLYNMAGNVNEWVLDVYRETSYDENADYNPYRGNVFKKIKYETVNGEQVMQVNPFGMVAIEWEDEDDLRDYRDGDLASKFETDYPLINELTDFKDPSDILVPIVNNQTRVYKGGSWRDPIYWLNPATRRFMQQDERSCTVGFRCAMSQLGTEGQNLK